MVADSERKRAKHTRSKRGCTVCRVRKVRCDETRPACVKCTSTGRKCEGFLDEARWKTHAHTSTQLIQPRPTKAEGSAEERSFAYFRKNTSAQFAAPFGNEFWESLVLQIGERERCVKQAIVALGALHESFTDEQLKLLHLQSPLPSHRSSGELSTLAARSYTCALRDLKQHILPDTYDGLHVSLVCCILFTSFEWLRGSYAAASIHLKSGLYILRQWSSSTSANTPIAHFIRKQLAPMFVRLSIQARTFSQDIVPVPWLCDSLFASPASDELQNKEEHLRAARKALDVLCGEVYIRPSSRKLFSKDFRINQPASFDFSLRLAKWLTEYHKHLLPLSSSTPAVQRPENVNLTLWYTVLNLLQATSWTDDPMTFDKYTPQFRQTVDLSRLLASSSISPSLAPHEHQAGSHALDTPRFRIDMEVVPMLYHVASRCRHPALRREAIALLRSGASREGLWDAWAAATLAEEILAIEEEGVIGAETSGPECIPRAHRVVKLIEVTDLQARTTRVRFQICGEDDYGEWRTLKW